MGLVPGLRAGSPASGWRCVLRHALVLEAIPPHRLVLLLLTGFLFSGPGGCGRLQPFPSPMLWKTGEDGLCCSSSAIQTRLGPLSLPEERSEIPIVLLFLLCCRLPPKLGETSKVYRWMYSFGMWSPFGSIVSFCHSWSRTKVYIDGCFFSDIATHIEVESSSSYILIRFVGTSGGW